MSGETEASPAPRHHTLRYPATRLPGVGAAQRHGAAAATATVLDEVPWARRPPGPPTPPDSATTPDRPLESGCSYDETGAFVDLHTIDEVTGAAEAGAWRSGDAWLAGGTFLFSEPQPHLSRLRDLTTLGWPALTVGSDGLEIAATCTIAELAGFAAPQWPVCDPLIRQCCDAFLASFKIQNVATVGGNLCTALPAGPMTSLTAALDGWCTLESLDGTRRRVAVTDFVVDDGVTALHGSEYLRAIFLPATALTGRSAFRQGSLHALGRSAALVVGRIDAGSEAFVLTITASTRRPVQLRFARFPRAAEVRAAVDDAIPGDLWMDDVHGLPAWRRHLTETFAAEIRDELEARP
ncbi:FAD binding domain-containing protein [Cryptosporangium minutisporangium]|uniref:FAD binding domain-containing protein n=1 Tax=Cryptosporangium minutisporangium TaxID=113569 RepID=A0ABP6T0R0_9ACTN